MPVATNEYVNTLDDIDSDEDGPTVLDTEQSHTWAKPSAAMNTATEHTSGDLIAAASDSAGEGVGTTHTWQQIKNVPNTPPVTAAPSYKKKGNRKGQRKKSAPASTTRMILLERADGRKQTVNVARDCTIETLRQGCLVDDNDINLWHGDMILDEHTIKQFMKRLWAMRKPADVTMQGFENDPDDPPLLYYYTGEMNGSRRRMGEANDSANEDGDSPLTEMDPDDIVCPQT